MEITPLAFKRLMKDVRDIIKEPLKDNGIYYKHDESNILNGYVLIIGPSETPYEYGNYLFKVEYPYDYPMNPPKITFMSNYGNIRMNPNLYRNGKVCISILNTWSGDQWSSCQTIKTVLLTLLTIFNNKPLLNEPGIIESSNDFNPYNDIISYMNFDITIKGVMNQKVANQLYGIFKEEINKNFIDNYDLILKRIDEHVQINKTSIIRSTSLYNMKNILIDYEDLKQQIINLYLKLK